MLSSLINAKNQNAVSGRCIIEIHLLSKYLSLPTGRMKHENYNKAT